MAHAQMHDGRAITAYVNGKAVDADGNMIEGAPEQPNDTDPSQQIGAAGLQSPEEKLAQALAVALRGAPAPAVAAPAPVDSKDKK